MADSFLFYNLSEAQMTFQDVMERLKAFVQRTPFFLCVIDRNRFTGLPRLHKVYYRIAFASYRQGSLGLLEKSYSRQTHT